MTQRSGRQARGAAELPLPRNLTTYADLRGLSHWLATIPAALDRAAERLALDAVGEPFQPGGQTAWVAPVHSRTFGDAVLKIAARHDEAIDEARGLRVWNGAGAVRLFAADDLDEHTTVLLLERCRPGNWLADEPPEAQDRVIAGLLRRLWPAPPAIQTFRPLSDMCERWASVSERWAEEQAAELDRGMIREGIALFRALARPSRAGGRQPGAGKPSGGGRQGPQVLLCTDLHAENVLAAQREPWLMVDPKPYVGDPAYDVLQHVINGAARFGREPLALAARMADLLDLDREHVRRWLFARCVVGAAEWPALLEVARRVTPS